MGSVVSRLFPNSAHADFLDHFFFNVVNSVKRLLDKLWYSLVGTTTKLLLLLNVAMIAGVRQRYSLIKTILFNVFILNANLTQFFVVVMFLIGFIMKLWCDGGMKTLKQWLPIGHDV